MVTPTPRSRSWATVPRSFLPDTGAGLARREPRIFSNRDRKSSSPPESVLQHTRRMSLANIDPVGWPLEGLVASLAMPEVTDRFADVLSVWGEGRTTEFARSTGGD